MTVTIRTKLTEAIHELRVPVVLAPMAGAAGGLLASQVTAAGGLGFIGAGTFGAARLESELRLFSKSYHQQVPSKRIHSRRLFGIGFLAWTLSSIEKENTSFLTIPDFQDLQPTLAVLDVALRARPKALWLSFGTKEEMTYWSRIIRRREAMLNLATSHVPSDDLMLFISVGDESQAREAVEDCGADVLIVQGNEAGGHGLASSRPLSELLQMLLLKAPSFKSSNPSKKQPLLLAAGGLMNGSHLSSCLTQGADGAVFGTRFLLTPEATYTQIQKQILLTASPASTRRSMAFDEAKGIYGWPEGVDGRGIMNKTVVDFELGSGGSARARQEVYKLAESTGDISRIVVWAGSGLGSMNTILPAQEIVREIAQEAANSLPGRCSRT
ncbi:hypothetical protein CBS101457_006941 [Exobasidium rhododendri]|nr:hypothetical protein CBS101457_006941 [Exobasidium rhododendri]